MSQIVRIRKTQMVEEAYLTRALDDLGYIWSAGSLRLGLLGPRVQIKVKGHGRHVGFRKQGRTYELVSTSGNHSEFLQKLNQRYVYHAARAKLEAQGFTLAQEEVQDGERIHLVLRRIA